MIIVTYLLIYLYAIAMGATSVSTCHSQTYPKWLVCLTLLGSAALYLSSLSTRNFYSGLFYCYLLRYVTPIF